jgi:hypothetical protein
VRWAILALVGATVCMVCDHLHATHGVLEYVHPVFWQQAWWVPLLFAGASIAAVRGATTVRGLFGDSRARPPTARQIAAGGISFVAAYAFTSFAPPSGPNLTLLVLVAFWLAQVVYDRPRWLILYSLLLALAGSGFEASWSALGFFFYRSPDVAGVPRWLPAIYLHAALVAGPLAERLRRG